MARRIVLDTSAYSYLRKGHAVTVELVAEASHVEVPATVLGELHAAFRRGRRESANLAALRRFLAQAFVSVRPADAEVARRYGAIFATLRSAGTSISIHDVWIAAAAMTSGADLLTFDSDFERVPGLAHTLLRP